MLLRHEFLEQHAFEHLGREMTLQKSALGEGYRPCLFGNDDTAAVACLCNADGRTVPRAQLFAEVELGGQRQRRRRRHEAARCGRRYS